MYPIFEEAASVCSDPYWTDLYTSYARGMLPRGVSLNGRMISHAKMAEQNHYRLSSDPHTVHHELVQFFSQHLGMGPDRVSSQRRTSSSKDLGWRNIKRKHLKKALLERFVETVEEVHSLTPEQVSCLLHTLYLADLHNLINGDTVEMRNGRIEGISSIYFDGETFYLDESLIEEPQPLKLPPPPDPRYAGYGRVLDLAKSYRTHMVHVARRLKNAHVKRLTAEVTERDEESR